ncbi:HD domain-containing protein [Photobacterium lutimaris]|uniref:HD Cas3-type domain-containing protein n=1 Tax=Photobacterium lutimaris TaxID=388278 RepID=A0A2T3J4U1_9GAMM|nr:HD domain-containing protein [Photobacterium lutimaris]PSU36283.1 hypothetical protein C9I99_04600 [Photobacterium lutimaris]TDR74833.1 CRISPR-associated endonuclease/helicase Cas3 [Photobacterium lutimaris]
MQLLISQMARLAGQTHDLGKGTALFQKKLNINNKNPSWPSQDPIRHEWVSVEIINHLEALRNGQALPTLLAQWNNIDNLLGSTKQPITDLGTVLKCVVATHHSLLSADSQRWPTADGFLKGWKRHEQETDFHQVPSQYLALVHQLDAMQQHDELDLNNTLSPHAARAVILLSRFYLIMADHLVSSQHICEHAEVYANTIKGHQANQSLTYHLKHVGDMAYQLGQHLSSLQLPGVSADSRKAIGQPAPVSSRFEWQNEAADLLSSLNKQTPTLVINSGSTGSGKTRMNARALLSLCAEEDSFRFTTLLGLRSLTLQTGEVFKCELEMTNADISTIIGDKTVKKMKSGLQRDDVHDDSTGMDDKEFDAISNQDFQIPRILSEYCVTKPKSVPLLIPPCLVSTVDYLIAAGEPHKQGMHVQALLRVMHSDVIIDEIDDYDPKAFVALCRLVEVAIMLGRNVVCSSATLPPVMVTQLAAAYRSGLAMYSALQSTTCQHQVVIISDYIKPLVDNDENSDIGGLYANYMLRAERQWLTLSDQTKSVKVTPKITGRQSLADCLVSSIQHLHQHHGWKSACQQKTVSVGLIRIANIKHIPMITSMVHDMVPTALVATYHSQDLLVQRSLKEQMLDELLTRKTGRDTISHPYLEQLITTHPSEHLQLVLIASPVEEVGRDHDFDWAIIEPSSVHSMVQTAGRVNRHRRKPVSAPNIIFLERNLKCVLQGDCDINAHYKFPGLESKEHRFPSHSLLKLLPEHQLDKFSAFLRFADNPMTACEDNHISDVIKDPISLLTLQRRNKVAWLTSGLYVDYPLREKDCKRYFELSDVFTLTEWCFNEKGIWASKPFTAVEFVPKLERAWLTWDFDSLIHHCKKANIPTEMGMRVSLSATIERDFKLTYSPTMAFQFAKN